ncbi:hypothetical protein [Phyllobacterium phragmitis]|uniref:Dehydrogenase n=1 Tax=Phyllobacterium phragmitis TaxID=2670329 RepID=A0ABQ0H542_9HYPH
MDAPLPRYEDDDIDDVLAYHGGDAHAAIKSLLADRDYLLLQIEIAKAAISRGFTRGWLPTLPTEE